MDLPSITNHKLKCGKELTVRLAQDSDSENFKKCIIRYIEDNSGQVYGPKELTLYVNSSENCIPGFFKNSNEFLLVAVLGGQLVGNLDFHVTQRRRLKHVGEFGMSVLPEYKGQGVGALLLSQLLVWAKDNPDMEKINLRVLSNNLPALSLYKKFGFQTEGRKVREIKYKDGSYADSLEMCRFV